MGIVKKGPKLFESKCAFVELGVTRSKETESDTDIRKTRIVFKNFRFCGKKERFH